MTEGKNPTRNEIKHVSDERRKGTIPTEEELPKTTTRKKSHKKFSGQKTFSDQTSYCLKGKQQILHKNMWVKLQDIPQEIMENMGKSHSQWM